MAKKKKFEYPKDMLKAAKEVAQFNEQSQMWDDPSAYSALRLAEECTELAKELVCYGSRPGKTTPRAIALEMADVILRMEIFIQQTRKVLPLPVIRETVELKCNKYRLYMRDGEKDII